MMFSMRSPSFGSTGGPMADAHREVLKRMGFGQSGSGAREALEAQAGKAGAFADTGEQGFGALGTQLGDQADFLRQLASGQHSIAGEQLRQGLQQNIGAQRSMAASATPQNAAMAARNAAMNAGRLGSALSGQQSLAGLQERRDAQSALAQLLLGQRGQDLNAALGGRNTAVAGYGQSLANPEQTLFDKLMGALQGGAEAYGNIK